MAYVDNGHNQYNDGVDHEPVVDTNSRVMGGNLSIIAGLLSRMRPTESYTSTRGLFEGRYIPIEESTAANHI